MVSSPGDVSNKSFQHAERPAARSLVNTRWILACALAGCGACAGHGKDAPPLSQPAASDSDTLVRIQQLIGGARCSDSSQCRVAGVGERPCGGPEQYLAWSVRDTDAGQLARWMQVYAEERRRWYEARGMASTCEVRPTPAVSCIRTNEPLGHCGLGLAPTDAAKD